MTHNRRTFLSTSARVVGASWLSLHWPSIVTTAHAAHAARDDASPRTLMNLTKDEARDLDAFSAQIIPTDDVPGAREAGVVYFIDQALSGFYAAHRSDFLAGAREFATRVDTRWPGKRFADLGLEAQLEHLRAVEATPFFATTRFLTIVGFLASPAYGGNRDHVGWQVVGFDDRHVFEPPFGYYDRDYAGFVPYDTRAKP
jgi:gluconate 2-dehydrogenase gamma chain